MMYKIFLFIFFSTTLIYSQNLPYTYLLENKDKLKKTQSEAPTPMSNSISDIVISGDTILLGTGRGLSLSTNRGDSWINFYKHPDFGIESISAVALKDGNIWCATAHSIDYQGQSLPEGSGLRFSSNGGLTWSVIDQPVDHKDSSKVIYGRNILDALPITTRVNNITYDIALTKNTIWIVSFAGGLRKSTNGGKSFERVVLPPDNLDYIHPNDSLDFDLSPVGGSLGFQNNLNHRVFSVFAENDSTIWVGTAGGINKSTDGGLSWRKFNHQNQTKPISGNFVVAISGAFSNGKFRIYAASWKAEDLNETYAISYTSDGGETWILSNEGERFHNFGFYKYIVYAAGSNGLFRSDDYTKTWIKAPTIYDSLTKQSILTNTFYSVASQGNYIWVGSNDGLARTIEDFSAWSNPWTVYLAFVPVQSKSETYAYPNPFDPINEVVRIKYSTGGVDEKVTIRIFDYGFNLVRTLIQNAQRFGSIDSKIQQTQIWDGKDEFGNYVSNGVYFYSVEIGSEKPIYGKIIVLK